MEKQKISKKIHVSSNEYDFALLMRSQNVQIPGFRKGSFNRSILDVHIGPQAREYIRFLKIKELFDGYENVSDAKSKMYVNNDVSNKDVMFVIEVEFEGVEKPKSEESELKTEGHISSVE